MDMDIDPKERQASHVEVTQPIMGARTSLGCTDVGDKLPGVSVLQRHTRTGKNINAKPGASEGKDEDEFRREEELIVKKDVKTTEEGTGHDAPPENEEATASVGDSEQDHPHSDLLEEEADGYAYGNFYTRGSLDVDSNETDSAMGDMTPISSTMSVNSSIYNHVTENSRTYHRYKEGKYFLPNDVTEQNRLDIQHQLFVHTLHGKLHLAPLSEGIHNVLDLATGTGIWAIEFATRYPTANVLGTDLSPIQPVYVPPNCRFEVDDAEDDWTYSYPFDYIHGRLLLSCFNNDFPGIISKAYAALNPGGWIELQDILPPVCFDDSWEGTDLKRWLELTVEGARVLGMDWGKVARYREWVEAAGFEDVSEFKGAWPTNTWPRDKHHKLLGAWQNVNLLDGCYAISVAVLTRGLGWTSQEVEALLVGVRRDLSDRNIHCYSPVRVIWARKPGGDKVVQNASLETAEGSELQDF